MVNKHNKEILRRFKSMSDFPNVACVSKNTGLRRPHQCHTSDTTQPYHWPVLAKILACIGHNSSNMTGLCRQKFLPASATTPAIWLACVRKNTGLCRQKFWHASATTVTYIGHNSPISLACVSKNTGLRRPQHLSALAISLADISHTTTPASIPRFPGSRESDQLGTVCRFWEWNQSAHCSAPMWRIKICQPWS